jgi:Mor family transcriptional regulator
MNVLTKVLGSTIHAHLVKNSVDKHMKITADIIDELVHKYGGQMLYLPNNHAERTAEKHRQILADFNGSNHAEIYQKYRIGSAWLKKLLNRAEAEDENITV